MCRVNRFRIERLALSDWLLATHGAGKMGPEKRTEVRRPLVEPARIESVDGSAARECTMIDVSPSGARLELATSDPLPSRFFLTLACDRAHRRLCSPAWQTETRAGVRFILN